MKKKEKQDTRIQNKELESKTQAMQDEFERLMEELNTNRKERDPEAFY